MLYNVKGETWGYEAQQRMRGSRKERETTERGKNRIQRKSGVLCPEPAQVGAVIGCINFARPLCEKQAAPHSQVTHWLHCPLLTNMCKHTDTDQSVKNNELGTQRPPGHPCMKESVRTFLPTEPQGCFLGLIQSPLPPFTFSLAQSLRESESVPSP